MAASLMADGYFIEPRLKLRDGGIEVLELDIVATPSNEQFLQKTLVEAKSGNWGFPDVFKVSGWARCLRIDRGLVVHKQPLDKKKAEVIERLRLDTCVGACHLPAASPLSPLIPCNGLSGAERMALLSIAWFALNGQRLALGKFTARYKGANDKSTLEGALAYQKACEQTLFERGALERVHGLCEAHRHTPNVTGAFMEQLATSTAQTRLKVLYRLSDELYEPWLQHVMLVEHKARIGIIKNALDHLLNPQATEESFEFAGTTLRWSDMHLPPGCRMGLTALKTHPHAVRIPYLFQMFIEVFGGFYAPRLPDELDVLSRATGIPVPDIPDCLSLYDKFFPFDKGWFYERKDGLRCMKMIPAFVRGAGCFLRHELFGLKSYSTRYQAGRSLSEWHNSLLHFLHPELGLPDPLSLAKPS